jgi:hypothetical protein
MQETIIWTYTRSEKETFESKQEFIGCWLEHNSTPCRLFIYNQKCVEFNKENGGVKIVFYTNASKPQCPERSEVDSLDLSLGITLFHHNWRAIKGSELVPREITVLDYSSTDRSHHPRMLEDITGVKTAENFIDIAMKWIGIYKKDDASDLIRRAQHSSLNLFLMTGIDVRSIENVWQKRELERLKHLCEELAAQWKGYPPVSHSPYAQLIRLWYLIAGKNLDWKKMKIPLPVDVSLPRDNVDTVAQCLLDWMKFFGRTKRPEQKIESLRELLRLSGLKISGFKFEADSSAPILNFSWVLEIIVNSEHPHLWLETLANLMKESDREKAEKPLNYLWHLLSAAENSPINTKTLIIKGLSYPQFRRTLLRLKSNEQNPSTTNFFDWLNKLSQNFDQLEKELNSLSKVL